MHTKRNTFCTNGDDVDDNSACILIYYLNIITIISVIIKQLIIDENCLPGKNSGLGLGIVNDGHRHKWPLAAGVTIVVRGRYRFHIIAVYPSLCPSINECTHARTTTKNCNVARKDIPFRCGVGWLLNL